MLRWFLVFLALTLAAGLFVTVGIDGVRSLAARLLFFAFLVLFVMCLLLGGPGRAREAA